MMNSIEHSKNNSRSSKEDKLKNSVEEKKFAQLPPDTVTKLSDSVGIANVHPNIARALSEDASYRCREITHICGQFQRHGKKRKLSTIDFSRALKVYNCNPIYGHPSSDLPSSFIKIPEIDLYVPDNEKLTNLTNYSLSDTNTVAYETSVVKATWLSLEGNDKTDDCKPLEQNLHNQSLSQPLMAYYSAITNGILDESKEKCKIILEDLETNSKIGNLLPYFVTFIRNALQKYYDNQTVTCRLLNMLQALFSNPYLNLGPKPYLSHLVTGLLSSLIIERRGREIPLTEKLQLNVDHVLLASRILRQVLDRWATPINLLRSQTLKALTEYLKDIKLSYSSHYGTLGALIALGPEVLEDCFLPQLNSLILILGNRYENNDPSKTFYLNQTEKKVIIRVRGMFLKAVRAILEHRSKLQPIKTRKINHYGTEIKREPFGIDTYDNIYDHFGDAVLLTSLPPLSLKVSPILRPVASSLYRTKFNFRKSTYKNIWPNNINNSSSTSFNSKQEQSSSTSNNRRNQRATTSTDASGTDDNSVYSSPNFNILANMGVPSDIFDDPIMTEGDSLFSTNGSSSAMDIENGNSRGILPDSTSSSSMMSPSNNCFDESVKSAFEDINENVNRYPKILFKFGTHEWNNLKQKSFKSLNLDLNQKRSYFIGRKLGFNNKTSNRYKLLRRYSCSLSTVL